jgi:hypothetical protein
MAMGYQDIIPATGSEVLTGRGLLLMTSSNESPLGMACTDPLVRSTYRWHSEALMGALHGDL